MKKLALTAAVLALVVGAGYVAAQQSRDGSTTPTGGLSYWPMGGTDGTSNRVVKLDPNGILRVADEYPVEYQTDHTSLCTADSVYVGLKFMGRWYCAPFKQRTLFVQRAAVGATVDACYLYLYGSDDDLTYYPVLQSAAWSDGVTAGAEDTLLCDTLRVSLPSAFTVGKFTLPENVYPGRYLAIFAKRDSATVITRQVLTIAAEGRMD